MARQQQTAAMVLAAGGGTRMKSGRPKILHPCAGRPLLTHVLVALQPLPMQQWVIVTSQRQPEVERALVANGFDRGITYAVQDPPRGTADAVRVGLDTMADRHGTVLIANGDQPLLETKTFEALLYVHETHDAAVTVLTANISDPTGYGRVIRGEDGAVERIVEDRDAGYEERAVDEINAGVYVFDTGKLADVLERVDRDNQQGEFYLTDAIALLHRSGEKVESYRTHPEEVLGVNSRAQLARVTETLRRKISERWMDEGVTIVDPSTTYIDASVQIGRDATIHPFTFLEGSTSIGEHAEIGPQARVLDSTIEQSARVTFSVVMGSTVGPEASVGPFASLRPGSVLDRGARVGTFVETKQTTVGEGSKAPHLSYLGDAEIGRDVNIGAGTITCNWDGVNKHPTIIEDEAYISSDTMLVAPTRVGKRAATGAGAVVRGEVPDEALAVGIPARIIEGKGNRMSRDPEADESEKRDR